MKFLCFARPDHELIMRQAVVGDCEKIQTTWGSLTWTQSRVHKCFCVSPAVEWGRSGRDWLFDLELVLRSAKATGLPRRAPKGHRHITYAFYRAEKQNLTNGTLQRPKQVKVGSFFFPNWFKTRKKTHKRNHLYFTMPMKTNWTEGQTK